MAYLNDKAHEQAERLLFGEEEPMSQEHAIGCPFCGEHMKKIMPLVYQGPNVDTYACKNEACEYVVAMNVSKKEKP